MFSSGTTAENIHASLFSHLIVDWIIMWDFKAHHHWVSICIALYSMFLVLFTVCTSMLGWNKKILQKCPNFFNYLQYDARFVVCHLISFIGIYCPPAVNVNAHFLPASCQPAFLELLCIYISPTLFFSSLFVAPSLNMQSNLQMSCNYPQKGT